MHYISIITYENGVKAVVRVSGEDRDEAFFKAKSLATRPYRSIDIRVIEKPAPPSESLRRTLDFKEHLYMALQ